MVGILTEKESAKRNFANALGGLSGTFNGEDFVITSARGHLYELMAPELQVPRKKQSSTVLGPLIIFRGTRMIWLGSGN